MPMEKLSNVTVTLKANIYFDGGVVSHTLQSADGKRQTIGLIRPGHYHFTTDAPERMDILAGRCSVVLGGKEAVYEAGQSFDVPGKCAFDIAVDKGLAEYLCTFG